MIHTLIYQPVFNLLILLYDTIGDLGLAIVAIALLTKLITYPLTRRQIKSAGKNKAFQDKMSALKKKYKDDQDKLTKEMAKMQAEFLPGQIGGCLNIIISIILLFQIRNVVIDLFNEGVHAFNQEAYVESMKFDEDTIAIEFEEKLASGVHEIVYTIPADNDSVLEKVVIFGVTANDNEKKDLENKVKDKVNEFSQEEKDRLKTLEDSANIGVYIKELHKQDVIVGEVNSLVAYLRPPSEAKINYDDVKVEFDGEEVEEGSLKYTEGDSLDIEFLGLDLSRTASDFDIKDTKVVAPYIVLGLTVGITQFLVSRIQTGVTGVGNKDEDKKKKEEEKKKKNNKDEKPDEPDFSELMAQSSQRMIYFFPILTFLMSLGYLGGGSLFPSGVSLFWTGQNTFVIIQQLIMNRNKKGEEEKSSKDNKPKASLDNKKELPLEVKSKKKKKKKKKKSKRK